MARKPVPKVCKHCGRKTSSSKRACPICSRIKLGIAQIKRYLVNRGQTLTKEEIESLVKCERNTTAQKVVDKMIARETAIIKSTWTENEYYDRAGLVVDKLVVTNCSTVGEANGFRKRKGSDNKD